MMRRFCMGWVCVLLAMGAGAGERDEGRADGLRGEYFADVQLKEHLLTRLDPGPTITSSEQLTWHYHKKEALAVRWTGAIEVPRSGEYTFHYRVDDEVRVWIDDELVIEQPSHHDDVRHVKVTLKRGRRDIRIEYLNSGGGGAELELAWEGPRLKRQSLDDAALSTGAWDDMDRSAREAFHLDGPVDRHRVRGLRGEYYEGEHFDKRVHVQRDRHVAIPGNYPIPSGKLEHISVRWMGVLKIDKAGEYRFHGNADDGLWLWIDHEPVIDHDGAGRSEGRMHLSEGLHPIRIEHNQGRGGAHCELAWSGPGFKKQVLGGDALWTLPWKNMKDPAPMVLMLMYGHSNMAGRSKQMDTAHPRTWRWEGGAQAWRRIERDNSPAGPLLKRLAEANPGVHFAAVKATRSGGTMRNSFRPGRRAFKQLARVAREARPYGRLGAVVTMIGWCEGGENRKGSDTFGEDFVMTIDALREELNAPRLPFVVSQIEVGNPPKTKREQWQQVHAAINQLPRRRSGVIVVPSNTHFKDTHHYTRQGYDDWTKEATKRIRKAKLIEARLSDKQPTVTSLTARGNEVKVTANHVVAVVDAKVIDTSEARTVKQLGSYRHCLIATRCEVRQVIEGKLQSKRFIAIAYSIRDRKMQPASKLKPGDKVKLTLGNWQAQKHLHSLAIDDDLDDLDSPQLFVLEMGKAR